MHAPNRATQVTRSGSRDFYAGVCQSGCPSNDKDGWFVPYRRVPGFADGYEAVINLYVHDLSSTLICVAPFVIDTATDVTIIPRRLMIGPDAFQTAKALGPYRVKGLTGKVVVGQRFRASMFIPLRQRDETPLSFGVLKPVVVDEWEGDYGTLGLDALRRVVMVSDKDHVSLWPAPISPCKID